MIKSMTGFGRGEGSTQGLNITVEFRSVNHRYYEFSARIPRNYGYLEDKLKALASKYIARGKLDCSVSIVTDESSEAQAPNVAVNMGVAKSYINALKNANTELALKDDLSLTQIMRFPDVFVVSKAEINEDELVNTVLEVATNALDAIVSMRVDEGANMYEDICSRLNTIESIVNRIEELSPQSVELYRNKLYDRICEVLNDKNIDEQRILMETAIFADKTAIAEETVRLHSHIAQMNELLSQKEPVGRKLDFLIQEFNREANTIGSKAQNIEITRLVVDLKSEIEKIREQIQNIE